MVLNQDERFLGSGQKTQMENRTTIAAIVTSLGGPPAAVGIVRLSGPLAVDIAGKVFRQVRKRRKRENEELELGKGGNEDEVEEGSSFWQPTSHVVEYGVVLDCGGNVVDEV